MTTLVLGVVDVAYGREGELSPPRITKKGHVHKQDAKRKADAETVTTAKVAQILEDKYGVMQHFYDAHTDDIAKALIDSVEGALEDVYAGSPVSDPFAQAGQDIAADFRMFLMSAEIEHMGVEGVPTQAALDRRSLRFKSKQSDKPRPSFVDSSLYEASFRAWTE